MNGDDISLDAAMNLIADVVGPAGGGFWSLSAVRERNVNGRNSVRAGASAFSPIWISLWFAPMKKRESIRNSFSTKKDESEVTELYDLGER